MRPSDLRRRIVLQSRITTSDGMGQQSVEWTDYYAGAETGASKVITNVLAGTTTRITCAGHGYTLGQLVTLSGIVGAVGLPRTFGVMSPADDTFLVDLDTSGLTLSLSSARVVPVSGVPASIEPLGVMERSAADARQASLTHKIMVRYHSLFADPTVTAGLRAITVSGAVTRYFTLGPGASSDSRDKWVKMIAGEGEAVL